MKNKISRRRFLGGSAALLGGSFFKAHAENSITPNAVYRSISPVDLAKKLPPQYYPPALMGLRGDHDGSQNAVHAVARAGKRYSLSNKTEEQFDLVVVGAGISGLSAAYYYAKHNPDAKILILENHDDFGGHAKRNEFTVDGKTIITYGGSESLEPHLFSKTAHQLLKELGIEYHKFERYFQQNLYEKEWKLTLGAFFSKKHFGKSTVVPEMPDEKNARKMIAQFPMSQNDKQALITLYTRPKDYWQGKTKAQRLKLAQSTSYYDFLKNTVGLGDAPLHFLQNISSDYWGHAINAVSVLEAWENGYPGLTRLRLPEDSEIEEPYIYHFPDGNASVARLLVRKLIPHVAKGSTMEDIVTAQFDYSQLDDPDNNVRIRLNSTAVHIENTPNGTNTLYIQKGSDQIHQIQAAKTIYAGHAIAAAHIIAGMSETQKEALQTCVKIPMVYTKVLVKNAHAWRKLGVLSLYCPMQPYCLMQLDDPVTMGDYVYSHNPDDPIVLHLIRIATDFSGSNARDMYKIGRNKLAAQKLADLENEVYEQMREIYALAGENFDDVVLGMTFNRWAHGYAYEDTDLLDTEESTAATTRINRQTVGNIYMSNTDFAWKPYLHNAIDEAYKAVQAILKS